MQNRFTHKASSLRRRIRKDVRSIVFQRDDYTCQYCSKIFDRENLTIDHVIPLALGGSDEITNYVSACAICNQKKRDMNLASFASQITIKPETLPVHGDPIIDNAALPLELRLLRKKIFDRTRMGKLHARGPRTQQRLEKAFRRDFWQTSAGLTLAETFPSLPGHVRIMIPEIQTIASNEREALLLLELAKSANTRNLIGTVLKPNKPLEEIVRKMSEQNTDKRLKKRLEQALSRFERALHQKTKT